MSLRIRMARGGTKKRPYYRIVVADSRMPRDGRFIERVGSYNPMLPKDHEDRVLLKEDRVKHWLGVGALPSDRVSRFLEKAGLGPKREIPNQTKKSQPSEKTLEKRQEREEKLKAKAEAEKEAKEAAAAAPAEEEAPTEEAAAEEAAAEAPAEEKPAEEAAAEEKPAEEAAAEEKPAEETKTEG